MKVEQSIGNQQLCNLSNNQIQVLLSAYFGDGTIHNQSNNTGKYSIAFSSISQEYMHLKHHLLENLCIGRVKMVIQEANTFRDKSPIHKINSVGCNAIGELLELPLQEKLAHMDELGLALWFYDDGSLHKDKLFYNLCTHAFTKEEQKEVFIPFLATFGIKAKLTVERKKDGREFYYLSIGKYDGANVINDILRNVYVEELAYKLWSSETIQKWSKLQEKLKSKESMPNNLQLGCIWRALD